MVQAWAAIRGSQRQLKAGTEAPGMRRLGVVGSYRQRIVLGDERVLGDRAIGAVGRRWRICTPRICGGGIRSLLVRVIERRDGSV